ncbi:DUF1616 domain-containing protein [Halorubellus sp. JP-L1]|uniref:DUF1616 domain-containing protein n=1 Tax=Halorubellus sp. JP-L1 TaxID=2715753 RepID=UPI00140B2D01|nr:DUF1616 domain-containing protein [Halorubellus sp. JP-L1]NHN43194.1 DUF1616 domain-containing protein [Halorubellus sp. JP-L1]
MSDWRWTADLVLALGLAVLAVATFAVGAVPWPIRWAVGIPLLVFVPGYALVAATFPERAVDEGTSDGVESGTPGWAVLLGIAVLASAVASAVVATAFAAVGALSLLPVAAVLVGVTAVGAGVAALRRSLVDPQYRRAPLRTGVSSTATASLPGTRRQNLALAGAVVVLVAAAGLTAAFPATGEAYSEFYVLQEDDSGDLVAEGYPSEVVAGEGHTFHLAVENREQRSVDYTVVVVAQNVSDGEVIEQRRLDTASVSLEHGQRRVLARDVVPETTGEDVRIRFFLYKGDVPSTASEASADTTLQVWTDVVAGNSTTADEDTTARTGTTANAIAPATPSAATALAAHRPR